jgi:hypothetical protein
MEQRLFFRLRLCQNYFKAGQNLLKNSRKDLLETKIEKTSKDEGNGKT